MGAASVRRVRGARQSRPARARARRLSEQLALGIAPHQRRHGFDGFQFTIQQRHHAFGDRHVDAQPAGQGSDFVGGADAFGHVAEGGEVAIEKMTTSTRKATIKKAMKGIGLTDEAVLSGYGNPVGEANTQLAQAIAAKVDNDCMDALQTASLIYDGSQAQISYNAIVDAVDLFEEEMGCSDKVLFIHPKQVTQLRKNPDFLSADKYTPGVSLTGEIGMIAGCRLVPSKKVPLAEGVYACPIVKLEADPEVDDEIPALTIYRKREVNIETERKPKTRTTEITADEFYVAVLSNEAKVVLAKFKA